MAVKNKKAKVLELDNLLSVPTFNRKINFGKNSAAIQFTNSTSPLIISGSNNGLNISGSSISVDTTTIAAGTAANASSFIALDSNNKLIKTSAGAGGSVTSLDDDVKLHFGDDNDAHIEYNENGDDFLIISGSSKGIVLSGSTIQIAGTLEGASPLKIGGEVQFTSAGDNVAFNFGPNKESKIYFGNDNFLTLSGSHTNGAVVSGSTFVVGTTNGMGVGVTGDDITHAITLPNNDNSTGRIKANAYVSYSSQRYKKEIKVLDDPMNILNKIEGVSFKWKDTDRLDYGFIAEDVGKVLPNIVSWEDNKRDAQGMDYLKIISFLVEAVKNQQKEINKLKQTLK